MPARSETEHCEDGERHLEVRVGNVEPAYPFSSASFLALKRQLPHA
jgi:hypothetical protein